MKQPSDKYFNKEQILEIKDMQISTIYSEKEESDIEIISFNKQDNINIQTTSVTNNNTSISNTPNNNTLNNNTIFLNNNNISSQNNNTTIRYNNNTTIRYNPQINNNSLFHMNTTTHQRYNNNIINNIFSMLSSSLNITTNYNHISPNRRIVINNPENLINGDNDVTILSIERNENIIENRYTEETKKYLAINKLRRKKYGKRKKNNECNICYEKYKCNDRVVVMKCCKYIFHYKCVRDWYNFSYLCPLCKKDCSK
ncbi:hypothetical protein SLOPH_788 [Spraguea lophii 42_110]|uniref:RING-type domain-containing protein n=1 Tax=Spraguea lophii (strain 42_110) TaxID=1358809 RepID=S7WCD9_SPRLO|nr:hypothetical protein SLOPH_788 [Spraguea lophii 42_110]